MPSKTIHVLFLLLIICSVSSVKAEMQPVAKHRAGTPPDVVLAKILQSEPVPAHLIPQKKSNSAPYITWLADADARLQSKSILQTATNQIFPVRNLGNQLLLSAGTVDYGVRHLLTPVLLITAMADSKAIAFFGQGYGFLTPDIRQDLDHLHLPLRKQTKQAKKPAISLLFKVEKNVDFQVTEAMKRYSTRIKSGRLAVIGSIFDTTGLYGKGKNRLVIINVNGEKEDKKLKKLRIMSRLDKKLLNRVGRGLPDTRKK